MALALITAFLSDFSRLVEVFKQVQILFFLSAFVTASFAYGASALSFRIIFQMVPYRVPLLKFFSIMFISDTVNFIISSGGMSSIANRALLLKREGVPVSVSVPLSLAQNMIFNLTLCGFCAGGLFYLQGHPEFTGGPKEKVLFLFMGGLLAVVAVMALTFLHHNFRQWVLGLFFQGWDGVSLILKRPRPNKKSWKMILGQIDGTIVILTRGWARLGLVFLLILVNWFWMALTFYLCFRAVGVDLPLGLLAIGFMVMFLSSNINPVPAGLGVSESLLAFTFKMLGAGFESTLVAALLFRLVYYLIPLAIATGLYLETMRSILREQS